MTWAMIYVLLLAAIYSFRKGIQSYKNKDYQSFKFWLKRRVWWYLMGVGFYGALAFSVLQLFAQQVPPANLGTCFFTVIAVSAASEIFAHTIGVYIDAPPQRNTPHPRGN